MTVPKKNISSDSKGAKDRKRHTDKIALLFTDMRGSTEYYKKHGDLAGRIAVEKIHKQLFSVVSKHRGIVVKTIGDSIMTYFYSAQDALWAAIDMQLKMQEYDEGIPPDEQIQIKIAINWGYGIIEESDVFGDVVNVAGKVISFCPAEKIYVTEMFFNEVNFISDVDINQLAEDEQNRIQNVKLYEVDWKSKGRYKDEEGIFLLSLKADEQILEVPVDGETTSIKNIIQDSADIVVNFSAHEVNAAFLSSKTCLETAFRCLKTDMILQSNGISDKLSLKAGIHAVVKIEHKYKADIKDFQEAINAVKIAQPSELIVTSLFYQFLDSGSRKLCKAITSDDRGNPYYRYLFGQTKDYGTVITSLVTCDLPSVSDTPCFYCSSFAHKTRFCPSKFIQKKTDYIEKLGYIPIAELFTELNQYLPGIVKPLESSKEDDRFSILFNGSPSDQYSIYFFSFYEVCEIFQLRSLHNIFFEKKVHDSKVKRQSGDKQSELLLGEDCLRVSRLEEADEWFKKALNESEKDYRPLIGLGILAIENYNPESAVTYFNNALAFSLNDMQKSCIHILIARVYEIAGAFSNCLTELEKSLSFSSNHHSGRFYKASVLCQMKKTSEAFDIFNELVNSHPKYFFMMALNPALMTVEKQTTVFFNKYIEQLRALSLESYENIQSTLNRNSKLFDNNSESFLQASKLYQKAGDFINRQSLYGLMDIHAFENTVSLLMKDAFSNRRNKLSKQITSIKNILLDFSVYLERFPYKGAIAKKNIKLFEELRSLYDSAKASVESNNSSSLEEAQQIIDKILLEKEEIKLIKKRLESIKKIFFVMEAFLHFAAFFIVAGGLSVLMFVAIIVLYNSFERSFSDITANEFVNYFKFALIAGFFSGLIGTSLWFKSIYRKLKKKIE